MTTPQRHPLLPLSADEVLTTTRSVRKRLDFSRPVERSVIEECLRIAQQAPSASNRQHWHFMVVTDPAKRLALASPVAVGKLITLLNSPDENIVYRAATGILDRAGVETAVKASTEVSGPDGDALRVIVDK